MFRMAVLQTEQKPAFSALQASGGIVGLAPPAVQKLVLEQSEGAKNASFGLHLLWFTYLDHSFWDDTNGHSQNP